MALNTWQIDKSLSSSLMNNSNNVCSNDPSKNDALEILDYL